MFARSPWSHDYYGYMGGIAYMTLVYSAIYHISSDTHGVFVMTLALLSLNVIIICNWIMEYIRIKCAIINPCSFDENKRSSDRVETNKFYRSPSQRMKEGKLEKISSLSVFKLVAAKYMCISILILFVWCTAYFQSKHTAIRMHYNEYKI